MASLNPGPPLNGTEVLQIYGSSELTTTQDIATLSSGSSATIIAGSSVILGPGVGWVFVNKTVGSPTTITLPANPLANQVLVTIKDKKGDSNINPIIVNTSDGKTIDGSSSAAIMGSYEALGFKWDGSGWSIV